MASTQCATSFCFLGSLMWLESLNPISREDVAYKRMKTNLTENS